MRVVLLAMLLSACQSVVPGAEPEQTVTLLSGGSPGLPSIPVTDIKSVAGVWEGLGSRSDRPGSGPVELTVKEDGSAEGFAPLLGPVGTRFRAGLHLVGGVLMYENPSWVGTVTLHEKGGEHVLRFSNKLKDGSVTGWLELRPARQGERSPEAWLRGSWEGILSGRDAVPVALEVGEVETAAGAKIFFKAQYGPTGTGSKPVSISMKSYDPYRLQVRYPEQDVPALEIWKVTAQRMDGFVNPHSPDGRRFVRFWKRGVRDQALDPKVSALVGSWEGALGNCPRTRVTVEYIDSSVAAIRYEWEAFQYQYAQGPTPGGWARIHAAVQPDGGLVFRARETFTFTPASGGRYLEGRMSPSTRGLNRCGAALFQRAS